MSDDAPPPETGQKPPCNVCATVCEILGDTTFCEVKMDELRGGKITRNDLKAAFDMQYGPDWKNKVMDGLKVKMPNPVTPSEPPVPEVPVPATPPAPTVDPDA